MDSNVQPLAAVLTVGLLLFTGCQPKTEEPSQESPSEHGEHAADAHGGAASMLMVRTDPPSPRANEETDLNLMVHGADGTMVKDFEVTHEKLAHLIIVREGLDEFAHLHPDVDADGNMTVAHTFPVAGKYRMYLDHKPVGKPQAMAQAAVEVAGDAPKPAPLTVTVPGHIRGDGLNADVTMTAGSEAKSHTVQFAVQDEQAAAVSDLQPYLGAMGHLVVLSADGLQYVHAHPLDETATDGNVRFEVHFPGPGLYKAWGQFQHDGKVFTIPAVIEITSEGHPS